MKALRTPALCLALFFFALWLRLPGLGSFLTPDEGLWAGRTAEFLKALETRDWAATYITGHPGVMTTWAGVTGLAARWAFARPPGAKNLADLAEVLAANPVRVDFLPWLRLPIVLVTALGVVLIFLLARRLFREPVALLGAAFVCFDPFFLAHGRVLQLDALLTTFTTIAWLSTLVATRTGRRRYFVFSGAAFGLAILTKSPALVLGPLLVGWIVAVRLLAARRDSVSARGTLSAALLDLVSLGLPAILAIFLLWPALWSAPLATLGGVWGLMTYYGGEGHELGNYWLGQAVTDPGRSFYAAILLWRTTAITLPGFVLALGWTVAGAWKAVFRRPISGASAAPAHPASEGHAVLGLVLFVAWYGLILSLGDKKFDRYVLPIFPAIDLLAAWGWWVTGERLVSASSAASGREDGAERPRRAARAARLALLVLAALLVGGQAASALANRPTYFTAYNPLAGGIKTARNTFIVGWGEGLAEAAGYLNRQAGASGRVAATWYGQNVFGPFYQGKSYDLYYDTRTASDLYGRDVDYVVTYVNQEQRALLDPTVRAHLTAPLFSAEKSGVPLAQVYAWPKPFAHTTDQRLAPGLVLLGWETGAYDPQAGVLPVTTYWDAAELAGSPDADARIVTWMKDAAGEVWAQAEAPLDWSAQTPGWLDRRALAQTVELHGPSGLAQGEYRVEVAPFAGGGVSLGAVSVAAAPLASLLATDRPAPTGLVLGAGDEVLFGDKWRLAGYTLSPSGEGLDLDLLWAALKPPQPGLKLFVHVVDEQGTIIAQHDGTLAGPDDASPPALQPSDAARQRVHLALPADHAGAPYHVYVGIYRSADQQRLPVTAGGAPVPDGRYELHGVS